MPGSTLKAITLFYSGFTRILQSMLWVFLLTKPAGLREADVCLRLALTATANGHRVHVYLVGNSVKYAVKGNPREAMVRRLLRRGGRVYVNEEDLKRLGIPAESLIEGVVLPWDLIGRFMDEAVKKGVRTVCF